MREQDVVFTSVGGARLAGTLALPDRMGPVPTVLMITGSGQVDRDENHRKLRINVMRELAGQLAAGGIASLRYDKRGVGASEGDFWSAGFHDNAADVSAALRFLVSGGWVTPSGLFLLGHSEGAYLATRVAAAAATGSGVPALSGIILLAGGARSGEEELRWQAVQVSGTLTGFNALLLRLLRVDVVKAQAKQLAKIKRSRKDWYRVQGMRKLNAKWMREFLEYDPSVDLAAIKVPMLAITGGKDIQVDPANLERMATLVHVPFEPHVLPGVTHLLREQEGPAGLTTYKKQLEQPVDPRVPALVIDWIKRQERD